MGIVQRVAKVAETGVLRLQLHQYDVIVVQFAVRFGSVWFGSVRFGSVRFGSTCCPGWMVLGVCLRAEVCCCSTRLRVVCTICPFFSCLGTLVHRIVVNRTIVSWRLFRCFVFWVCVVDFVALFCRCMHITIATSDSADVRAAVDGELCLDFVCVECGVRFLCRFLVVYQLCFVYVSYVLCWLSFFFFVLKLCCYSSIYWSN